jgi:retinol dehydrogenase-12
MSLHQTLSEFYPPKPTFTEKNLSDLSEKVYLITGGTSGIGLALAKILYSKNAKVYITSRTDASAEKAIA